MADQNVTMSNIDEIVPVQTVNYNNEEVIENIASDEGNGETLYRGPTYSDHSYLSPNVHPFADGPRSLNLGTGSGTHCRGGQMDCPLIPRAGSSGSQENPLRTIEASLFALPDHEPKKPISFKSALEFIPKSFDGKNIPVGRFVRDCIYARNCMSPEDRQHLFLIVRSRITGNAYDALLDRDISTLEDLLKALKKKFTTHRNLSQLQSSLATLGQNYDENVSDYGDRVGEILKNIIEVTEETNSPEAALYMIKAARKAAQENFVRGLKKDIGLRVLMEKPQGLQEAISVARSVEWDINYTDEIEANRNLINEAHFSNKNSNTQRFRPYNKVISKINWVKEEQGPRAGSNKSFNNRVRDGGAAARGAARGGGHGGHSKMTPRRHDESGRLEKTGAESFSLFSRSCYRCHKPEHLARDCPSANTRELVCYNCSEKGHYARDCPRKPKSNSNDKSCKYCKKLGHIIEECRALARRVEEGKTEKKNSLNE